MDDGPTGAICSNCEALLQGRYCAQCGQDNRHARVRFAALWSALLESLFGIESRLLRTLRELTIDPGGVVRRYLAGQRVRYVHPLRYVLVTCALWWLVVQWAVGDPSRLDSNPVLKASIVYGQWINLVLLPVLAVPWWAAFARERFGYVEHLCFLLFTCGHVFLWRAGLALLGAWFPDLGPTLNRADGVGFFLYVGYAGVVCFRRQVRWVWLRVPLALVGLAVGSHYALALAVRWVSR